MLDSDKFLDRRRLKRHLIAWRTLAIMSIIVLVVIAIGRFGIGDSGGNGNHIAQFWISGLIHEDPEREALILEIAKDNNIKALILRINSPGGTMAGSESLFLSLREVALKKPLIAILGGTATSGAYMAALAADQIFARKSSVTGSIGVILQTAEVSKMLENLGISTQTIKSSPLKGVPSLFESLDPSGKAASQAVVDDMYDQFISLLVERRGLTVSEAKTLADGRIYTGRQALSNGLVDQEGGRREAIVWLEQSQNVSSSLPIRDIEVNKANNIVDWLISKLQASIVSRSLALDGLLAVWQPDLTYN